MAGKFDANIVGRLDALEIDIAEVRRTAEAAEREAQNATSDVDDLRDDVEALGDCECTDEIQALRDEIRYLENRMRRLESTGTVRSAAS